MDKSTFLILQKIYIKTAANNALNKIITSGGIAIYFPKTPDVLIKSVAKSKKAKFLMCEFSIVELSF